MKQSTGQETLEKYAGKIDFKDKINFEVNENIHAQRKYSSNSINILLPLTNLCPITQLMVQTTYVVFFLYKIVDKSTRTVI